MKTMSVFFQTKNKTYFLCFFTIILLIMFSFFSLKAQRDLGDAPSGQGTMAYNNVEGAFTTQLFHTPSVFDPMHDRGGWVNHGGSFFLGRIGPGSKPDSQQMPQSQENDAAPRIMMQDVGPNPIGLLLLRLGANGNHPADQTLFINVLIDQNRDGQWKDGYYFKDRQLAWNLEWMVRDAPVQLNPGVATEVTYTVRLEEPTLSHWIRIVITDRPIAPSFGRSLPNTAPGSVAFWDGSMSAQHNFSGEIEDHLLQPVNSPNDLVGIFPPGLRPIPGKPACLIGNFIGPNPFRRSAGPFGFRTHRVLVPHVPGNPLKYSLEFSGGSPACNNPGMSSITISQYGYIPILPNGPQPVIRQDVTLAAPPVTCPDGTLLPAAPANQPGTGLPLLFDAQMAFTDVTTALQQHWDVIYPDPIPAPRRIWGTNVETASCGSEIQNFYLTMPPEEPIDLSDREQTVEMIGTECEFGEFMRIEWIGGGDIFESFNAKSTDPTDSIPLFPNPDFSNYEIQKGQASSPSGLIEEDGKNGKGALLLLNGDRYTVQPALAEQFLPNGQYINWSHWFRAKKVSFWVKGVFSSVELISSNGDVISMDLSPSTYYEEWTRQELELAPKFDLYMLQFTGQEGLLDDLHIALEEKPFEPTLEFDVQPAELTMAPGHSHKLITWEYDKNKNARIAEALYKAEAGNISGMGVYTAPEEPGEYYITVIHEGGTKRIPVKVVKGMVTTTRTLDYASDFGTVFPNPAFDEINLKIKFKTPGQVRLSILDLNGKLSRSFPAQFLNADEHRLQLPVRGLEPGLYFIRIQSAEGIKTFKFIKN